LVEDDQIDAAGVQILGQVDEVLEGSSESVELGDDELVTFAAGDGQCLLELRPAGQFPGSMVDEDLVAAGRGERVVLRLRVLIAGRHPAVADAHARTVTQTPERVTLVSTRFALQPRPATTGGDTGCTRTIVCAAAIS